MELLEYENWKQEICSNSECEYCKIADICNNHIPVYIIEDAERMKAIAYVVEYAKRNRQVTNLEAIEILFQKKALPECPKRIFTEFNGVCDGKHCKECVEQFWNAPYTGPMADKLNEWRQEDESK